MVKVRTRRVALAAARILEEVVVVVDFDNTEKDDDDDGDTWEVWVVFPAGQPPRDDGVPPACS